LNQIAHRFRENEIDVADEKIVYAVGDIHGRLDLLSVLTEELKRSATESRLAAKRIIVVFLGDYIDRGPDSSGVLSHLIEFAKEGVCETIFLRGNHEQFLLDLVDGHNDGADWLEYGGLETLRSYGVEWPHAPGARSAPPLAPAVRARLTDEHLSFLRATQRYTEIGDHLFVHAGLRPDRLLSEQSDSDMLWYRYYSDEAPIHGKIVVHGHTPRERPVAGRWRIGIDTEAYASGALTALRIEGAGGRFLKVELPENSQATGLSEWEELDKPHDAPSTIEIAPLGTLVRRLTMIFGVVVALALAGAFVLSWRHMNRAPAPPILVARPAIAAGPPKAMPPAAPSTPLTLQPSLPAPKAAGARP
jgi:serine/threonine protein phosphatase 1